MRRCFVISPIGDEGSPIREHADYVFYFIIKPALDECGIQPIRADHLSEPGRISDHVLREIVDDDLCIAVLTGQNPNVFFELAVALSRARPTILLSQKGEELPFDVRDLRVVSYDLKPLELFERTYAQQIVNHVRSLEAANWESQGLFDDFGSMAAPQYSLFLKSPARMPNLNIANIQWDQDNCFVVIAGVKERIILRPSPFGPAVEVRFDRKVLKRIKDEPIDLQLRDYKGNDWKVGSFYLFQSVQPLIPLVEMEKITQDYGDEE